MSKRRAPAKRAIKLGEALKPAINPTNVCRTCLKYPGCIPTIRAALQVIIRGPHRPSFNQLRALLKKEFDYQLKATALRKHIRTCEPELYSTYRSTVYGI